MNKFSTARSGSTTVALEQTPAQISQFMFHKQCLNSRKRYQVLTLDYSQPHNRHKVLFHPFSTEMTRQLRQTDMITHYCARDTTLLSPMNVIQ